MNRREAARRHQLSRHSPRSTRRRRNLLPAPRLPFATTSRDRLAGRNRSPPPNRHGRAPAQPRWRGAGRDCASVALRAPARLRPRAPLLPAMVRPVRDRPRRRLPSAILSAECFTHPPNDFRKTARAVENGRNDANQHVAPDPSSLLTTRRQMSITRSISFRGRRTSAAGPAARQSVGVLHSAGTAPEALAPRRGIERHIVERRPNAGRRIGR